MHVEILIEYFSLSAFSNGKQVSLPMIMKSDINSVSKLEQNLYKFQNSRTIIESTKHFCLHLLTAKTIFDKGLLFEYLRILQVLS